ncbi:MAG: N-acetylmuramoyl-L-alanine amidase [Candidatus Eisenbacteria bacterium]
MRSEASPRRVTCLILVLAFLGALAGCAGGPRPRAGYERRVDPLDGADGARLTGRRIVIDPGHGGYFRGAMGVRGLTEAEVNLGVALELAKLLRERGAEVLLTRETNRDFLTPADSSLRSDLNERVRLGNAFRPELFVSIHHNADARGSHDVNEVQVYYQLGDEGPALEAAADIHRFLSRNLGIAPSRLIPGNFAVLRGSEAPALLTESSYITYPPTERKLAGEEARRLEAEAIYLGIAAFFARRAPVIEEFRAWTPGSHTAGDSVFATGFPELRARVRGAFDVIALSVDGKAVTPTRWGNELAWSPAEPLAAGAHEAILSVRLAGEGSAQRGRVRFDVRAAAESLMIELPGQPFWDGNEPLGVRLRVLSREGVLVRDSLRLRVRHQGNSHLAPPDTTVSMRDGVAWAYFRPSGGPSRDRQNREGRSITFRASLEGGGNGDQPVEARMEFPYDPDGVRIRQASFALQMPDLGPLRDALGTREPNPALNWINRDGFVLFERHGGSTDRRGGESYLGPDIPSLRGYHRWVGRPERPEWPPRFVPIVGGALHGRRIVVDAAGGGDDAAGTSASGGRGAALNLEVARMLSSMLEAAGAEVRMTRTSDAAVSELERVRISEAFRTERYVRIGHPAAAPRLGHYFSSAAGRRWAENLAGFAVGLGLPRPSVGDDAQYPIQQTSATALYAALGRVDQAGAPFGGFDPARLRTEAYAIYLSLAREWAPNAGWPLDYLDVRDTAGRPLAGAVVRFGDALVLQTDPLGRIRFARTEPGSMLVKVENSPPDARRVLVDSDRGVVLTRPGLP